MRLSRDPRFPAGAPPRDDELQALLGLELAEAEAGESGYTEHALRRLAADEERWRGREFGLARLVDELSEGAADLGSWGVLALKMLEREEELDTGHRELIEISLRAAVLWGACVHSAAAIARRHLDGGEMPVGRKA